MDDLAESHQNRGCSSRIMPQLKNSKEPICKEQPIGLIGAGGHSKVIQEMIVAHPDYSLCAVLDDQFEEERSLKAASCMDRSP